MIDRARGEIFVVADELIDGKPAHRLAGLSIASGRVEMTADVDPQGAGPAAPAAPVHIPRRYLAAIAFAAAAALTGLGWLVTRRLRRAR